MTTFDKLVAKLFASKSNFTHRDAQVLLRRLGYTMKQGDGSRVRFETKNSPGLYYHIPHGRRKTLPTYILDELKAIVLIKEIENE